MYVCSCVCVYVRVRVRVRAYVRACAHKYTHTLPNRRPQVQDRTRREPFRPAMPAGCSDEAAGLIRACWATDPAGRPAFTALQRQVPFLVRRSRAAGCGAWSESANPSEASEFFRAALVVRVVRVNRFVRVVEPAAP